MTVDRNARTGPLVGAGRRSAGLLASLVLIAGAALILVSAIIHLHLWASGYRNIHTIGPLFLVQGVAVGILMAVAVALIRRVFIAVLGVLFAGGTLAGLLVSVHVGLFGYREYDERALGDDVAHHRGRRRGSAAHRWRSRSAARKGSRASAASRGLQRGALSLVVASALAIAAGCSGLDRAGGAGWIQEPQLEQLRHPVPLCAAGRSDQLRLSGRRDARPRPCHVARHRRARSETSS